MARSKLPKMTAEEHAQRDENQRRLRERIAIREAREREWDEAARRAAEQAAADKPSE